MNRLLTILTLALAACSAAAEVPASLARAARRAKEAPALNVACTINGHAATLTTSGTCFRLDLGGAKVFFDGKTQWSYSPADKEVTILNPTPAEIAESNPLVILQNINNDFDGKTLPGKPDTVRLTPRNPRSSIAEATITFNSSTGWPTHITLISGGQRIEISALKFSSSKTKPAPSTFSFQPPSGTTITDLR